MKYQLTIEARMSTDKSYGQGLVLGDIYTLELNTLSDAAAILVKVHELCQELLKKAAK